MRLRLGERRSVHRHPPQAVRRLGTPSVALPRLATGTWGPFLFAALDDESDEVAERGLRVIRLTSYARVSSGSGGSLSPGAYVPFRRSARIWSRTTSVSSLRFL